MVPITLGRGAFPLHIIGFCSNKSLEIFHNVFDHNAKIKIEFSYYYVYGSRVITHN
jgi:hypothetical protein